MARTAVITGASSGIGLSAAKTLAAQGWAIIGVGRDAGRSAEAEKEIRAASTGAAVTMLRADIAVMADVERLAKEIAALTDRVDVLMNNAGGMATEKVVTVEGYEQNFASNHLGGFLLTDRLLPLLRNAAKDAPAGSVRVLQTSSDASEMTPGFNWDDLQQLENFNYGFAYCNGKLANVLFTRGLAKRVEDDGIVAHVMHPGAVVTNFESHAPEESKERMRSMDRRTPEQGADTLVWLATDTEAGQSTGGYYFDRAPRTPNPLADDDAYVERFWTESEKLLAATGH